ncbi:MAG: fibronectin type III domain-containing protein [Kofleriaceae bacterium]
MKLLTLAIAVLSAACLTSPDDLPEDELDEAASELTFPTPTPLPVPVPFGPQPTTITPTSGVVGTPIVVSGSRFLQLQTAPGFLPRYVVRLTNDPIGSLAPAIAITSDTQMTVTVPAGSFGGFVGIYEPLIRIDPITHERSQRLYATSSTSFAVVPTAPTNLVAVATGTTSVQLSWRDTSHNESAFEVSIADPSFRVLGTVPANQVAEPITGLLPDTTYQFRIRALAGTLGSAFSNTVSVRTRSNTGTLRINNTSQYMVTSIRVDNTEMLAPGFVVLPRTAADFTLANGPHSVVMRQGANTAFQSNLFTQTPPAFTIVASQTSLVTIAPIQLIDLLTAFSGGWAEYTRVPALPGSLVTYYFEKAPIRRWQWRQNGTATAAGVGMTSTSWPDNALFVDFRLDDGTTGTYDVVLQRFVARPVGSPSEAYQ